VEDAVSYVKKYRYLDDVRYARTFICFHQEKRSRMRIRNDLMRRSLQTALHTLPSSNIPLRRSIPGNTRTAFPVP
ncbi:MAG: RecX family transcriptional regulator, partial [Schaedlerella arabinosiphila]|nr:RecX family transcriptional regulator [Schaedlerella arabinosiphila]